MPKSLTFEDSINIAAPINQVYALVSDITRTGKWSPVCEKCWWDEDEGPVVGAHFTGRNVTPERTWETRSEVIVAEPNRCFGWSVTDGNVKWIYSMEPLEEGTVLTESWEFTPKGQRFFHDKFGDKSIEEIEKRRLAAITGIPETLVAIQRILEVE